jgi:signal transduction histidine kinase
MDNNLENLAAHIHRWTPFIQKDEPKIPINLCDYINELKTDFQKLYPNLTIEVTHDNPVWIELAKSYFFTLIRNLIDNANYWTSGKPNPLVKITILQDGQLTIVRISDNGRGIPVQERKWIFIPGWSAKPQGSGIGLKLAGEAANALGGQLVLVNGSEMENGATFELRIPEVKK